MIICDYIVRTLIKCGVTDTFGIPGGVILRLLDSMHNASPELSPHLLYNEQTAGFAALGYAQASGKLGVAYATRGPGITNMVTCIAEAYQESLPVLFITAHSVRNEGKSRFMNNQELDIVKAVEDFTLFSANVENAEDVEYVLEKAINVALSRRKGPVILDFSSAIFGKEFTPSTKKYSVDNGILIDKCEKAVSTALEAIALANRPVILIGDGIRNTVNRKCFADLIERLGIPVLSSRGSQDLLGGSSLYFGYVGSHGIRYSNFILSKADLIIVVGNRMAFPFESVSFSPIIHNAEVIRIDIDANELERHIDEEKAFVCDGSKFLEKLSMVSEPSEKIVSWCNVCRKLKTFLYNEDCNEIVERLVSFISTQSRKKSYVCDVGNNEFWFSRAYEKSGVKDSVYCSKSFGTLGVSIGRAIGVYYATGEDVVCVCGDQGFQYNIQELQYISYWKLPIIIVLLNNNCSGMICDHEKTILGKNRIHVDLNSGYSTPDFKRIAEAYNIAYTDDVAITCDVIGPVLYEIVLDSSTELNPSLLRGSPCQDMNPPIDRNLYEQLNKL